MTGFLLRRFVSLCLTLLAAALAVFLILEVIPGDTAQLMLGVEARPDTLEALRNQMGLDRPAAERFLLWIAGLLQGDLGVSYTYSVPVRDLVVSRQHRMLVSGPRAELLFGEPEVLVPAVGLIGLPGIAEGPAEPVTYLHFMFDRHEIVLGNGAWSESFQPGDRTLGGLDAPQRDELMRLFPELDGAVDPALAYPAARVTLKGYESRILMGV